MGNNNLSNSEDIYVKVDQNNLIYIDPNTSESTKAVNYVEMIPILLLKIKDMQTQIDHLTQTR